MEDIEIKGRKVAIDLGKANVFAIIILVASALLFAIPFFLIWKGTDVEQLLGNPLEWSIFFGLMIGGIVVHELIHGITWACYTKGGWSGISFGVIWKMLTPYCHCDEPMRIHSYMIGAMMPCVVLGIIPSILALFLGSLPLLIWGVIFISAAAGDIWITWLLTKEDPNSMVLDHPTEAGFYILDENANDKTDKTAE